MKLLKAKDEEKMSMTVRRETTCHIQGIHNKFLIIDYGGQEMVGGHI